MKRQILAIIVFMLMISSISTVLGNISNYNMQKSIDNKLEIQQTITESFPSMTWLELAKLTASEGNDNDEFGYSVAIDGEYTIIGAHDDDNSKGSAYVFKRFDASWTQQAKLTASDGVALDEFGGSVSISGEYAIIGAHYDDISGTNEGSTYVFKRSGTSWTQQAKLTASDGANYENFGGSVSIDGEYAIIGAYNDDNSKGAAYVFKRSGTSWTQQAKLTASDGVAPDQFGYPVEIDGEYAIIGAANKDSYRGAAYVFKRSGTSWSEQAKLTASDSETGDYFGGSASIDGEYVIIGAFGDDTARGAAYVFKRSGTSWTQQEKLVSDFGSSYEYFGRHVSIDGENALIGAYGYSSSRGIAFIFNREGTTWNQLGFLMASDGENYDVFGCSVSIDGRYAIIGAIGNDNDRGSAYIFYGNSFPNEPSNPSPENHETDVTLDLELSWTGGDPDGDPVTYDISFGTFGDMTQIATGITSTSFNVGPLEPYTEYYWRITATDSYNYVNPGPTWDFTTGSLNNPPNTPNKPSGPNNGDTEEDYTFQTVSQDPEEDLISYGFNWGDGSEIEWTGYHSSGIHATLSHSWVNPGQYEITVKAKDYNQAESGWSQPLYINIGEANDPPLIPSITGNTDGTAGEEYEYTFSTSDPNDNQVYYKIEWGDGNTIDWDGPYDSGLQVKYSHTWSEENSYTIKCKAKDIFNAESDWGTLPIEMPKNKIFNNPLLQRIFERNPIIERLMNILFNLI